MKTIVVKLIAILVLIIIQGCNSNNGNKILNNIEIDGNEPEIEVNGAEHTKVANSAIIYHRNINSLSSLKIEDYLNIKNDEIKEYILSQSSDRDNLSSDTFKIIKDAIIKKFTTLAKRDISTIHGSKLSQKYINFYEKNEIAHNLKFSHTINEDEKIQIENIVKNYFDENDFTSDMDLLLTKVCESFFAATTKVYSSYPDETSPQDNIFTLANKTAKFKKKMKVYFSDFNTSSDEDNKSSVNYYFTDKLTLTNTFNGDELHIHKPLYDSDGELYDVENSTKDISFPQISGVSPKSKQYHISIGANIHGSLEPVLFILKEYKNNLYYAFELYRDATLKRITALSGLSHVSDVATADIDADGYDEIIIAYSSPDNKIIVYNDVRYSFIPLTHFNFFKDISLDTGIVRVASADVDGDGKAEIAAAIYDESGENWDGHLYMWSVDLDNDDDNKILKERINVSLKQKTPLDILFADLNEVDNIELFLVQLDEDITEEHMGWNQPELSGYDDYCRYFKLSTNKLNIYNFANGEAYNLSAVEKKSINIENYTYDKKYNSGGLGGKYDDRSDGVICAISGCRCVDGFEARAYHLYVQTDDIWRPIYATAYHTSLNKHSMLDIDGIAYNFKDSNDETIYEPALNYYTSEHTHKNSTHKYAPVRTNSGENTVRKYKVTMKEGQRYYAKSKKPRNIPSASITTKDLKALVYRKYNTTFPYISRIATFGYPTQVLEYDSHNVLYTNPIMTYLFNTPPQVAKEVEMTYAQNKCSATIKMNKMLDGPLFGIEVGGGAEFKVLGNGAKFVEKVGFDTIQSSGNVDESKTEVCMEGGRTISSENDNIVVYFADIVDNYTYHITHDLQNPSNVGKQIYIKQKRVSKDFPYENQIGVNELYKNLEDQGVEIETDLKKLIHHDDNLSSYLTQTNMNDVINAGKHLSSTLQGIYSDKFEYSNLWYSTSNLDIPIEGGNNLKFSSMNSNTNGKEEHDQYEVYTKTELEVEAAGGLVAFDAKIGWEINFYHEKLNESSTESSYEIEMNTKLENIDYTHLGFFSYLAKPNSTKSCTLSDSHPINREDFKDYTSEELVSCKPPILVIDYWLSNQKNN